MNSPGCEPGVSEEIEKNTALPPRFHSGQAPAEAQSRACRGAERQIDSQNRNGNSMHRCGALRLRLGLRQCGRIR